MPEKDGSGSDHTTVISPSSSQNKEEVAASELTFENWDRYRVHELLGEGGTARVYSAIDQSLNRKVALKFFSGNDAEIEKRFLREARAQAQIEHPHVCKIYEVGTFSGRHYIAMQLIEGYTLTEGSRMLTIEQKVLIMEQVSEAIHAAHRIGVIHRDLKPSNIMIEKTDIGWHPYVLDFGLARESSVEGVTVTGMILGTPAYMSPEQAWGEFRKLDRRTDVYSLGATLYQLITGKPPYEGTGMEIIVRLAQEEPKPVRKLAPNIPQDLETIVMKCLERDPGQRYDSAKALAEDLKRYLDGDTIEARPASLAVRLLKKTRKHKAAAFILAISTVLVGIASSAGIYSWWRAGKQVEIAREFAQSVENMEWRMRVARMAPLHNLDADKKQIIYRMKTIRERIAKFGPIAEGPGNYALGRGLMELNQYQEAKLHLQKAWDSGYRTAENAYSLGLTLGHLYQQELEAARQIENQKQRETREKEIELTYRDPALKFLRLRPATEEPPQDYVEGLIAFYEKNYSEALKKSKSARTKLWWLYEAARLEGDVHMALGTAEYDKGNYEKAMQSYSVAGIAYKDAIQIGRSEPGLYESECWRWLQILILNATQTQPFTESMDQGLAACDLALKTDPESSIAYSRKSQIWWRRAEDLYYRGLDSSTAVEKSIEFAHAAVRFNPENFYALFELGNAYGAKAENERASALDPTTSWKKSVDYYFDAAKLQPNYTSIYTNRAIALTELARFEILNGIDPRPNLNKAIEDCEKAVRLNPESLAANNTSGTTRIIIAEYEARRGVDPGPTLQKAIASLERASKLSPDHPTPSFNLATAYLDLARSELNHGLDPRKSVETSIRYSQQALKLGGDGYAIAYSMIGAAHLLDAKYKILSRQDPGQLLIQSVELPQKSIAKGSNDEVLAYNSLLDAYCTRIEQSISKRLDPSNVIRAARSAYSDANSRLKDPDIDLWGAAIEILSARWNILQTRSPEVELNRAVMLCEKALKKYPQNGTAYRLLAEAAEVRAQWQKNRKLSAVDSIAHGLEFSAKSLELNPSLAEAAAVSSRLYWIRAQEELDQAKRAESVRLAKESLEKALSINANLKQKYSGLMSEIR